MKNLKKLLALVLSFAMILSLIQISFIISADETEVSTATVYVSANGSDTENDGQTVETPFATIDYAEQWLIDNAADSEKVVVVIGTVDFDGGVAHEDMITIKGYDTSAALNKIQTNFKTGINSVVELQGPTRFENIGVGWNNPYFLSAGYEVEVIDPIGLNRIYLGNLGVGAIGNRESFVYNDSTYSTGNDRATIYLGTTDSTQRTVNGVDFHFVNGRLAQFRIGNYNTFTGNVNMTLDKFGCDSSGAMEVFDSAGVEFQKAFQLILNNGMSAKVADLSVFEAINATEGSWFMYGEVAADGTVLRTTETAGIFKVEGNLVANAYKVENVTETDEATSETAVISKGGFLDLSAAPGEYIVKYTEPVVTENQDLTVYVSADGKDTNNGLTAETAFGTIDFAQKWLDASTAEGEKVINVIGTVDFDGGEPHEEMITINAHTSAALNRITTNGKFTELQGPTKFVGFNLGWNEVGYPLSSGYDAVFSELVGRNRIFVGNVGNGNLSDVNNVTVNDSNYSSDNDRTTVYIGTDDATTRTVAGVNFHFVNGRLAQFRLSNNNVFTGNVNLTLDKFGCLAEGVQLNVDGENIEFQKAFQFVVNNGYSKNFSNLSLFESVTATEGSWFIYGESATDGTVLRTTETAGIFKVEGTMIANAYKVVDGVESETAIQSVNGILDLSGVDNAGVYNVKYDNRVAETNTDSVVYVSSEGNDLFDGKTEETAFGSMKFALEWLALSSAENKKIIVSGEHTFDSVASDDMVTITSEDGSAILDVSNVYANGPLTFDNVGLKGYLYTNGNNVSLTKTVKLTTGGSGLVIGSTSSEIKTPDKIVVSGSGTYTWFGAIRVGSTNTIASYGLDLTVDGGNFNQFLFNNNAESGTHYGDVNITFNGAIVGGCEGKIAYAHNHNFNGALQFVLNGVNESVIDSTLYDVEAVDGEWFMIGDKTAKLSTTENEGVFIVNGAKYAKAVNREDATKVYYSKDGVLSVTEEGIYDVTYFNTLKQGDINKDGDIDIRDLVGIKNFIANILPYDLQADLNGDVSVSADDTVILAKHLLKVEKIVWEDTLKYLSNTYTKLVEDKKLNVAFMGGSVTDGYGATNSKEKGWPKAICDWLAEKYGAEVIENRQSIGGTGSYFGSFRFNEDIGTVPDLFFIEFAINDYYEGYTYEESVKYSETLVRNALEMNPEMDIVYVLTFDRGVKNTDFDNLRAHRDVAEKYGFLCIKIADEFYEIMETNGTKDYDYIPDGVHPNDEGYAIYAEIIKKGILADLPANHTETAEISEKVLPDAISNYYNNPHMLLAKNLVIDSTDGWYVDTTGTKMIETRYGGSIKSSAAGAKFSFTFKGKDFGILYHGATNIGSISVSIDGNTPQVFDGYYDGSNPKTFTVADDLFDGTHTVEITLLDGSFIIPAFFVN